MRNSHVLINEFRIAKFLILFGLLLNILTLIQLNINLKYINTKLLLYVSVMYIPQILFMVLLVCKYPKKILDLQLSAILVLLSLLIISGIMLWAISPIIDQTIQNAHENVLVRLFGMGSALVISGIILLITSSKHLEI